MADEPVGTMILARLMAQRLHAGQVRRDGEDYFNHCSRVAWGVNALGNHARAVGYLHDVLEDTAFTRKDLELLFGRRIRADVVALTRGTAESYAEFIDRIVGGSDTALMVKLADVRDNLVGEPGETLRPRYERAERLLLEQAAQRGFVPPPKPQ